MKEWIEVGIKLATSYSKSVKPNIAPLAPLDYLKILDKINGTSGSPHPPFH